MALPRLDNGESWWLALVDIQAGTDDHQIIPPDCSGAVGWMAAIGTDETAARSEIITSLQEIGLSARTVEDMQHVESLAAIEEMDPHLARNVADWPRDALTVWGSLHPYLADGEA